MMLIAVGSLNVITKQGIFREYVSSKAKSRPIRRAADLRSAPVVLEGCASDDFS
jgi:hypothetical protein